MGPKRDWLRWKGSGSNGLNAGALRLYHPWLANAAQRGFAVVPPMDLSARLPCNTSRAARLREPRSKPSGRMSSRGFDLPNDCSSSPASMSIVRSAVSRNTKITTLTADSSRFDIASMMLSWFPMSYDQP